MISREEIEGLAKLARIELDEREIASLQADVSNILDYVSQLQKANISTGKNENKIAPLHHNVLRADEPRQEGDPLWNTRGAVLEQLPKREDNFNVVRKILQKDE